MFMPTSSFADRVVFRRSFSGRRRSWWRRWMPVASSKSSSDISAFDRPPPPPAVRGNPKAPGWICQSYRTRFVWTGVSAMFRPEPEVRCRCRVHALPTKDPPKTTTPGLFHSQFVYESLFVTCTRVWALGHGGESNLGSPCFLFPVTKRTWESSLVTGQSQVAVMLAAANFGRCLLLVVRCLQHIMCPWNPK